MTLPDCFLVDGGTTNTRVWLRHAGEIRGPARLGAGVRDTAVEGSNEKLKRALGVAFAELAPAAAPKLAVAAGMITSPLGLMEVPHCPAPAGAAELARAAREAEFAEFTGIRWLLIPGVRSGGAEYDAESVAQADIIRGEETELMGALARGKVHPPALFIHVGSHTKAIRVDAQGRITGGITTLGGELLDVVRKHTILSSAVAGDEVSLDLLTEGAEHAQRYGLTRALFLVRLLEMRKRWSRAQLSGFLMGAVIAADLAAIEGLGGNVVVSAPDTAVAPWSTLLKARGCEPVLIGSAEREACFLAGIERIFGHR